MFIVASGQDIFTNGALINRATAVPPAGMIGLDCTKFDPSALYIIIKYPELVGWW